MALFPITNGVRQNYEGVQVSPLYVMLPMQCNRQAPLAIFEVVSQEPQSDKHSPLEMTDTNSVPHSLLLQRLTKSFGLQ